MAKAVISFLLTIALTIALNGCSAIQQPTARYRTATDPVKTTRFQCWPLPPATLPDFPLLAQSANLSAEEGKPRRARLTMTFQFFGVDASDATRHLAAAMTTDGFRPIRSAENQLVFARRGFGRVTVSVTSFDAESHAVPVEGTITVDVPLASTPAASKGTCPTPSRPFRT